MVFECNYFILLPTSLHTFIPSSWQQGNYRDDRFPQGVRSPVEVPYTVEAWECIDTLVYVEESL